MTGYEEKVYEKADDAQYMMDYSQELGQVKS